jgi:hypothetical protein
MEKFEEEYTKAQDLYLKKDRELKPIREDKKKFDEVLKKEAEEVKKEAEKARNDRK